MGLWRGGWVRWECEVPGCCCGVVYAVRGSVFAQCRDCSMVSDYDCTVDSQEMLMFIECGCVKEMCFVEETFVLLQ